MAIVSDLRIPTKHYAGWPSKGHSQFWLTRSRKKLLGVVGNRDRKASEKDFSSMIKQGKHTKRALFTFTITLYPDIGGSLKM